MKHILTSAAHRLVTAGKKDLDTVFAYLTSVMGKGKTKQDGGYQEVKWVHPGGYVRVWTQKTNPIVHIELYSGGKLLLTINEASGDAALRKLRAKAKSYIKDPSIEFFAKLAG